MKLLRKILAVLASLWTFIFMFLTIFGLTSMLMGAETSSYYVVLLCSPVILLQGYILYRLIKVIVRR